MVYLPFTIPKRDDPIPAFFPEWGATCLALGAGVLIANRWRDQKFAVPSSIWVVLVLLPSLAFHLVRGDGASLTVPLMYLVSIGLGVFMMIMGHSLATRSSRDLVWQPTWPVADLVAAGFFLAALTGAVVGWQWRMSSGLIGPLDWPATDGLVAKKNHNALLAWIGIFALTHLHLAKRVAGKYWLAGVAILADVAVYSSSRALFFYAAAGALFGAWMSRRPEPGSTRRHALWLAIFPVLMLIAMLALHAMFTGETGAADRFDAKVMAGDGRRSLWWRAIYIITEHPWLGAGPGSYVLESMRLADITPSSMYTEVPATHAHNLFSHLASELGIPFALMLGLFLVRWAYSALRRQTSATAWIFVGIPLVVLIHNQVEFSLWYLNYLAPVALCMGAASPGLKWSILGKRVLVAGLVSLLIAAKIGNDYLVFQKLFSERRETRIEVLEENARHPLFGPWISTAICTNDRQKMGLTIEQHDYHARRALSVTPLYRRVLEVRLEALEAAGNDDEAKRTSRLIRHVFGQYDKSLSD